MSEIIPAILPSNYEDLKDKISKVRGVVPLVQIDICDGVFVKSVTWPFNTPSPEEGISNAELDSHFLNILNEKEGLPFWEDIDFELDLMVHDAVQNFDIYTKLGPKRIIFHLEAVGDVGEFKNFLEGIDTYIRDSIQIGVAISTSTPIEQIFSFVNNIDFVQCMGIREIGYQGEEFDDKCLEHVKKLKEKFSDLIISVDGGVNLDTGAKLIDAGVDRLVAGSSIFNSHDIIGRVEDFKNL